MLVFRHPLSKILTQHGIEYPTPVNLNYFWGMGSLALIVLISQILTGVLLAMHYTASSDLAFASIEHIMRDVNNGWIIRYLHANGASFFFLTVYLHIARTMYYGYYTRSRQLLWSSGVIVFFLMMAIAFMGYVLPWGQMSFWGATVITNLFSALPLVGPAVAQWLWGGFSVANATLVRFFSLHYLLPFLLVALVGLHILLLHQNGSYNPLGVLKTGDKISFYPYFYVKDYFGFTVFCCFAIFIIGYYPDILGHSDNYIEANALVTPTHIVPEWYFLPFYAILRSIPNKLGGVVLMVLAILVLLVLPFYSVIARSLFAQGRLMYTWFCWLFFGCVVFLGHLGGQPIEEPYILFSQFLTLFYFAFFGACIYGDYLIFSRFYEMFWDRSLSRNSEVLTLYPGFGAMRFMIEDNAAMVDSVIDPNNEERPEDRDLLLFLSVLDERYCLTHAALSLNDNEILGYAQTDAISLVHARHPYHLVNISPWPFLISFALLALTSGFVVYFHNHVGGSTSMVVGLGALLFIMGCWFRDIIREATFEGWHTRLVQIGLKYGMILFIVSEVMFFFSFFWGFFHSSLAPAVQLAGIWPPLGITTFNPWDIPFLNTVILLSSGVTVTWAHYAMSSGTIRWHWWFKLDLVPQNDNVEVVDFVQYDTPYDDHSVFHVDALARLVNTRSVESACVLGAYAYANVHDWSATFTPVSWPLYAYVGNEEWQSSVALPSHFKYWLPTARFDLLVALLCTISLGVVFTIIQFYEYLHASYTISDSVYGSCFFLTTGFHGLHVLVGTLFLIVCFERARLYHFAQQHHIGLESAIWYWHFVDVVWLGLYISLYQWGGNQL